LENAVQLRHLTASIVALAATADAGRSLTISNFAFEPASIAVRRRARVTDHPRAAGRSIA